MLRIKSDFFGSKNMLVVATGVSGTGEKQYCERLISYAEVLGKKIKVFNTGDMFIEQAKRL